VNRKLGASAALLATVAGLVFAQPDQVEPPEDVELYAIDAERSEIYWRVHRAGALARFGHNHVVSVGEMTGRVLLHPELEQSRFEIEIPVEALVVDDPELRARVGERSRRAPSSEDIEGTRRNMLSEEVLDAERYPSLRIAGTGPTVHAGEESLEVTVELRGRSIPLTVPTEIRVDGETLEASGEFTLTHEELGLEPFSAAAGALRVGEPLDFTYRILARRIE